MEKIDEIRQALTETYNRSFNLKEPTASLFSDIEVLMLMTDEDPDLIFSQYHEREIQMYNYLINEMIMELRKRRIERFKAERIVRNVVDIRKPRPIAVQPDRNDWYQNIVIPNFKIQADLVLQNLTLLPVKPPAMDERNLTSDLYSRADDHRHTSTMNVAPTVPLPFEILMDERSSDNALQKRNIQPPTSKKDMFPFTSEVKPFRNLEEIEGHPLEPSLLADFISVEERELIRDFDLQISDAIRSNTLQKTTDVQQIRNRVDVEEALVTLTHLSPPLKRIGIPSTKELSSEQQVQFDELEVNLPEIPPEDIFIQEFRALFERRRREKAATDYAERATLRATKFSISNQIQNLFIKASNQGPFQGSLIDDVSLNTEFSNLIVNKPQSTPETPHYGKKKTKKWTSALPVLEEDEMDVQRAPEVSEDPNQIIIQSKPSESHQTPLTSKNVQSVSWKLTDSRSPLPVLQDEIELPPPVEIEPPPAAEIEPPPEMFVQKKIPQHSKTSYSDVPSNGNEHLIFRRRRPAKRPKTTEKDYAATEAQNLTEDAVFEQYLKSWKRSFLLSINNTHRDIHFPIDLLKMVDFGTLVHQVVKKLMDSGNHQLNYFLPPTSTRKEAAKRIHILLELRTQNVLDFIVQDGEVTGICIKS